MKPPELPVNVRGAMYDAAIGVDECDERGLMPVDQARAFLEARAVIERGKGQKIRDTFVWESDTAWAALLSLSNGQELLETASKTWKMPPRGLSNPAVAQRYGRDALEWAKRILEAGHFGPGVECLVATVSAVPDGGEVAYGVVRDIDAQKPDPKYLWGWLAANPEGWRFVGSSEQTQDREALLRLAKTDAKGVFAGIAAELGDDSARRAFEAADVEVPKGIVASAKTKGTALTLGAIEPKFSDFEYPMWDNANYFAGAMRVTGFVCAAGQALVWEQLVTGLGDDGISREVTVHASFPIDRSWRVHVATILSEKEALRRDGKDRISLLTGVRCVQGEKGRSYVVPSGGSRAAAEIEGVGEVPLSIDTSGLSQTDAALLDKSTGPLEKLMVRLGQEPFRAKVFPKSTELATEAELPAGATALFSFDVFGLPDAGQPASSSPDIVAMVDALASGKKLAALPSKGAHPLAALVSRCEALGGWGDPKLGHRPAPVAGSNALKDELNWWSGLADRWRAALQEAAGLDDEELSAPSDEQLRRILDVENVSLNYEGIVSIEAVRRLTKLKVLRVRGSSKLDTIEPIRELTSLEVLDIAATRVKDLTPLARLTRLRELSIDSLDVTDLTVLSHLVALEVLSMTGSPATSLRGLEPLEHLRQLNANSSKVSDISALAGAKSLQRVMLNWTTIADLSPLRGASALRILEANQATLGHVDLRGLEQLEALSAIGAKFEDFSFVSQLGGLKKLQLAETQLRDLGPVAQLKNLETLDISKTLVTSLRPLASCTALQKLELRETAVTSLDGVLALEQLTELDAGGTGLEDLAGLATCKALTKLHLQKTFVVDVSHLDGLEQLRELDISDTWVASVEALQGLGLDLLKVLGSDVTELALIEFLRQSPDTNVEPSVDLDDEMPAGTWERPDDLGARSWYMSLDGYYTNLFREAVGVDDDASATDEQCQQMVELEELDLQRGEWLGDLRPLEVLKKLRVLRAGGAHVKRLDVLASLPNLEELDLSDCRVRDYSPLGQLPKLARLNLKDSSIADLRPLAGARALTHLNVDGTRITSLAGLEALESLKELVASRCPLEDLTSLKGAAQLRSLEVRQTRVENLAPLAGLAQLSQLGLSHTSVRDLGPLAGLRSLHTLELHSAQASDYSALGKLPSLRKLLISGAFDDATALREAKALEELDASNSKLSSLRGLEQHPSLKSLKIESTRVSDLTPLATAAALQILTANSTPIADLTPLASLTRLSAAFLNDTGVTTLAPLRALAKLEMVTVEGALVSAGEAQAFRDARPEIDLVD